MAKTPLSIEKILALLTEAPPRIAALTATLTPTQLRTAPGEGEWSANDVLAHLRACGDMWGNAIATIIAADTPSIRAVNPTTWITKTDYPQQAFATSFHAYTTQRTALLTVLESLAPEDWARKATVVGAGRPLERTVLSYGQWMATHERPHVRQIAKIVKTMPY